MLKPCEIDLLQQDLKVALKVVEQDEIDDAPALLTEHGFPRKDEILIQLAALEAPLRERGLTSLALFGSAGRNTARPASDIDLLVVLHPDVRFSLIDLVSLKDFLEDRLGRSVDVVTKEGLAPALRDRVLREAEVVFS